VNRFQRFKPLLWGLTAVVVATLGAVAIVRAYKKPGQMTVLEGMNMNTAIGAGPGTTPVAVETVRLAPFEARVTYTGTIAPYAEQNVFPRVEGYLRDFSVYAGDRVRAGEVLVRLEAPDLGRKVAEARYGSVAARQDVAVSQAEVTRLERERRTAEAELSAAQSEREGARSQQRAAHQAIQEAHDMLQVKQAALQQAVQQVNTAEAGQRQAEKGVVSAQASVTYWQAELRRILALLKEGAVSQQEAQSEQAQHDAAVAAFEQAQAKVDETKAAVEAARANVAQMRADVAAAQSRVEQAIAAAESATAAVTNRQAMARAARLKVDAAQATVEKSRREVGQRQSMADQSQAALATARTFESFRNVVAPFSGTVTRRLVSPGTLVNPTTAILTIVQIDRVRLQANVAEADLPNIRVGAPVRAHTLGGAPSPLRGRGAPPAERVVRGEVSARVTSVFPQADPTTRTAVVEAVVANPGQRLIPGKYVTMEISTSPRGEALTVPNRAIMRQGGEPYAEGQPFVWVAVPGRDGIFTSALRKVTLGPTDGQRTALRAGLKPGDQVIYAGNESLKEGDLVLPSPWTETGPAELPKPAPGGAMPGMPGMEGMPGMAPTGPPAAPSGGRQQTPGSGLPGRAPAPVPGHQAMPGMPGMGGGGTPHAAPPPRSGEGAGGER
jgi:RND family efflux transporter MFP subunit